MTQPTASPTLDTLFKREPGATAGCAGAGRSPQQAARHRPAAEAPHLRAGRPHDLGAGGAFHRDPACRQFGDRGSAAQHHRIRAHRARRLSAPACVVAVLPLLWRQSELTMALNRTAARAIVTSSKIDGVVYSDHRHERRRRGVLDPPCLRLRQRPARRHGLARQRNLPGIPDHARRDPGRPQGGADFLRRHLGRLPAGAARPSRPDRRRPCNVARKRRAAGRTPSCRPSRRCRLPASPRRWRSGCCRAERWCCTIRSTRRRWNNRSTSRPAIR